jgi:ELWxxDGT repeat protein
MLPNVVLFAASSGVNTDSLWETNGTAAGTFELAPITGVSPSSGLSPQFLTVFNNQVLFNGRDSGGASDLWTTDGTAAGTNPLSFGPLPNGIDPTDLTFFNGQVLFNGTQPFSPSDGESELWTTNGVAGTAHELFGVVGAASTIGLSPSGITAYNGEALFNGLDSNFLHELWVTDGTAAGTHELTGITGSASVLSGFDPSDLTVYNGEVLFSGRDDIPEPQLWVTNGTAAGTHEVMYTFNTAGSGLNPSDLTVYKSKVLFGGEDVSNNIGLWVTDGTAAGTQELTGITGAAATGLDPSGMMVYGGEVLFSGTDENGLRQLWVTNGTAAGTRELTVVGAAATGLSPSYLTVYNSQVLFQGVDSNGKSSLWTTNGTSMGTTEVDPISGPDSPNQLIALTLTISGTHVTQTTADRPVNPFTGVTIGDPNVNATDTLTITLSNGANGTLFSDHLTHLTGGVYALTDTTAAAITADLDAMAFTPAAGAPGSVTTNTFALVLPHREMLPRLTSCLSQNAPAQFLISSV